MLFLELLADTIRFFQKSIIDCSILLWECTNYL